MSDKIEKLLNFKKEISNGNVYLVYWSKSMLDEDIRTRDLTKNWLQYVFDSQEKAQRYIYRHIMNNKEMCDELSMEVNETIKNIEASDQIRLGTWYRVNENIHGFGDFIKYECYYLM